MILREAAGNPAIGLPIAELSEHLRLANGFLDDGAEDPILETFFRNAAAVIERRIGQALIRRRFELRVSRWDRDGYFTMPVGPVDAISRFVIQSGVDVTDLSGFAWVVEPGANRQRLSGPGGAPLPGLPGGHWALLEFDAGHAEAWDGVPRDLHQATMLLAAHFYEHRGGARVENALPGEIAALLDRHLPVRL